MGFLSPFLLLAAAAVAVPLFLHLFHKHEGRRLSFPALRYLLRTEREHARRIRLRQLLLLFLRAAVVLLLALAAARPFLRGDGGAHRPTALAIVLDNSLSTGRVSGDRRVLDELAARARDVLDRAGPDDRIWVIRAGEPWDVSIPGDAAAARDRVAATEASAAAADLPAAVRRAAALVRQAGLPAAEVHVLTDLQATGLSPSDSVPRDVPVLIYHPDDEPPPNRYLGAIVLGGGLPPLAGRRSDLAVTVGGDSAEAPLRMIVGDRIRGAARAPGGATAMLPFGPFPEGWAEGFVETDADALRGDDRRWFAVAVRPPPVVAVRGSAPFFLEQALAVLEDGGRLRRQGADPDVVIAVGGEGAAAVQGGSTVVVVPPADPALLPGLNRRLVEAGIPWRYETLDARGEARVTEHRLPVPLEGVRVSSGYRLSGGSGADASEVMARLEDGSAWLVRGRSGAGAWRLVGSPFDPDATNLPVSAFMVPLLEWLVAPIGSEAGGPSLEAGTALSLPRTATAVVTPDGASHAVDGTLAFPATRQAGVYRVLEGDSLLEAVAVNPPLDESLLAPADEDAVRRALGDGVRLVSDSADWSRAVFASRQGSELWRPLLLLALLLLVVESRVAASGAVAAAGRASDAGAPAAAGAAAP